MKNKGSRMGSAATLLICALVFSTAFSPFFVPSANAVTGVPKIISYQGRLADADGDLLGGSSGTAYYFKFSIWDSSTSSPVTGTQLWPSASSSVTTSTVTSGVFNVQIGDTENGYPDALTYDFYENRDVYLQVEVSSNGSSFETLSPRQRIAASGFAVSAEQVTGKLYASSTSDYTFDVTNEGSGLANLSTEGQVQIGSFNAAPTTLGGGSLYYSSTTGQLFLWNAATTTPQWISLGGDTGGANTDLQSAYGLGNTITTTNARNILFTAADTATDANFVFNILGSTSTAVFEIQASSSPIFSVSRTNVTSTATLTALATTTVTGTLTANIFVSSGATLTGGSINNTPIGASGASTATFSAATSTGTFSVQGAGTALSVTNSASIGDTLTVTNALSAGNLNTAGTVTANIVNATTSLRVNNVVRIDQAGQGTFATTTIATLITSASSTIPSLNFTSATGTTLGVTNLSASTLTLTNALGIASGGTATTTAPGSGQLLIGNGTNYSLATLTPSTGISVQNAAGSITVTNTRPFVTSTLAGLTDTSFVFSAGAGVSITTSTSPSTLTFANIGVQSLTAGPNIVLSSATGTPVIAVNSTFATSTVTGLTFTNATGTNLVASASSTIAFLNFANATGTSASIGTLSLTNPLAVNSGGLGTSSLASGALLTGGTTVGAIATTSAGNILGSNGPNWVAVSLTGSTGLTITSSTGNLTFTNSGVTSNIAGNNILISGATGAVTISAVTTTIAAQGTTVSGPNFTFATTTSYAGGFNVSGVTFNFPGRINDINDLATTTGNLIVASGTTWIAKAVSGTDNFCLTASSTQQGGIAWAQCGTGGSGITSLNGSTSSTQTFSSANSLLAIGTANGIHTFTVTTTPSFTSVIASGSSTIASLNFVSATGTSLTATTLTLTNALGVASGGSGASTFTRGVLIASGTNAFAPLTGADGKVLTASSTAPFGFSFEIVSSTGGSGISELNGLIATTQTFSTTTNYAGGFYINSAASNHAWNFPGRINDINDLATTTGNLIVASGTTWIAKAVSGTDNFCLTASSTQQGGIAWAQCGTGGSGITSLNGSTSSTQTFSSANSLLAIGTANGIHTFTVTTTPSFTSLVATGSSTIAALNFVSATGTGIFAAGTSTINGDLNIAAGGNLRLAGTIRLDPLGQGTFGTSTFSGTVSSISFIASASSTIASLNFTAATGTTLGISTLAATGSSTIASLNFVTATGTSASIGSALYNSSGITPAASFTIGALSQALTLQGTSTNIITTSTGAITFGTGSTSTTRLSILSTGLIQPAQDVDIIAATSTGTSDLGSAAIRWDNIFAGTIDATTLTGLTTLTATNVNATGTVTADIVNATTSLRVNNVVRIDQTGQGTFATTTIATLVTSGSSTIGYLNFVTATGTLVRATTLISSGSSTVAALNFTAATGTTLGISTLAATGSSTIASLNFVSATGTGIFAAGTSTINGDLNIAAGGNLRLAGTIRLDPLGQGTFGTSTFSGTVSSISFIASASSTIASLNFVTATGTLVRATTLIASGSSTVASLNFISATGTSLTATNAGVTTLSAGTLTLTNALGVAQGGTATTTFNYGLAIASGTNAFTTLQPGTTGSLIVASSSEWVTKTVGTNGFVLTASSTAQGGISWEPASATGITSLNGSTSSTQTFSSANSLLAIGTANGIHTFTVTTTPSFTSLVATGSSTIASLNFTSATGTAASIGSVLYNSSGITPGAAFAIGAFGQDLTLQGATTTIIATSTNSIVFNTGSSERLRINSSGKVMVNTTATSTGQVNIIGIASGGATVTVAGIYQESLLDPSASGQFQFGNRHIVNVAPSASSSMVGEFIRTIDNTTLNNTVRAMELQAWSGTNVQGINTGLFAAGRTFGVQAVSNGTAGGIAAPAAIFGEITTSTQGQALRLYSQHISSSSQDLALFYQEVSTFNGTGLKMDFARTGGTFTGNYLNFLRNATSVFAVNATGSVMIGTSTPYGVSNLVVCAQSNCTLPASTSTVAVFASDDGTQSGRSISARGTITSQLADVGEYVPVEGNASDYETGDLLAVASSSPGPIFGKSRGQYDANLVGIVTPASAFIAGGDTQGRESVIMALAGRVLAKVSGENGSITPGDLIAASSEAGVGMKASGSGRVIGVALTAFEGTSGADGGTISVFVNPHYYYQSETEMLQGGTSGNMEVNNFTFDSSQTVTVGTLVAGKVKTQNLEVGASAAPSGITLYDTKTGEAYCVVIENGAFKSIPGKCDNFVFIPSTSVPLPSEEPAPEEPPQETATSTEEVATSTEEITTSTEEVIIATSTEEIAPPSEEIATSTEEIIPTEETATSTGEAVTEPLPAEPIVEPTPEELVLPEFPPAEGGGASE